MTQQQLTHEILKKKSFLCVGLDIDKSKLPSRYLDNEDYIFKFGIDIIEATHEFTVAYKPNFAFFEGMGIKGLQALEKIKYYLDDNHPNIFTIADAKRGDIGNTSRQYAQSFFELSNYDSVTVSPYMGKDSVEPFLEFKDKYVFLLALTSNIGAIDFQKQKLNDEYLFEKVIKESQKWENANNLMYVVGATQPEFFKKIRTLIPDSFLLFPGVGSQGGSLQDIGNFAVNSSVGVLVNSSRGIIYAQEGDTQVWANTKAKELQQQMEAILTSKKLLS